MSARFLFSERRGKDNSNDSRTEQDCREDDLREGHLGQGPAGPKKDTALKHYQAAEKAHTAKNDAETNKELDAAKHALA
ncbi:hypothetical protein EDD52_12357 [Primorskyibacter sedentarius]|uniref:Uncharacterized protein n=1 Tax=Primorskyibacter sedentarius TaxID=745311 RepID=A0A4V2UMU6_9RHOB|nr:hypothetical protein [Primorskyibacter sedentarius]TCS59027.1 hypothetical protein EDD52_12357 [Primorskyibacter sedentarius]